MSECPSCGENFTRIGQHWSGQKCDAPCLSDYLLDVAKGVVMGDGTVCHRSRRPFIEVKTVNGEYASYLDSLFGILSTGAKNTGQQSSAYTNNDIYRWSTRTHDDLSMFVSWYENGDKHIPEGIAVNDTVLSHWYVCDGTYAEESGRMFITCENDRGELSAIADSIQYNTQISGNKIIIPRKSAEHFFNDNEPINGFQHKWP